MKVLHITNWYPNRWNEHEAPFIKEQFEALSGKVEQELWHVQVRNEGAWFSIRKGNYSGHEHYLILNTRIRMWRMQELLTLFLLVLLRMVQIGKGRRDLLQIHIAYPLLRFPRIIKFLFRSPMVITEHWSAYRLNFNLAEGSRGKQNIQNIFKQSIPVITVSKALMHDIVTFAGTDKFASYIVPNVVDPDIFYLQKQQRTSPTTNLLMVGNWAPIKRPMLLLEVFRDLVQEFPRLSLRIVGYGSQWSEMQKYVQQHQLHDHVTFLGALKKKAIANEMRLADALVHPSAYETFSVVCAEALCCGIPVVASNVGGIPEFVGTGNGILVENTIDAWRSALQDFLRSAKNRDSEKIAFEARARFCPDGVGEKLLTVYSEILNNKAKLWFA
jgi:glycosyltransferase involved in cell wall biosynthesis